MVKRFLFLLLLTGSMMTGSALSQAQTPSQNLNAFVDRTDISVNDVFTLTLRIDAQLGNVTPSFTGLNVNFEQLGLSRKSAYSNSNGNIQSWNEYQVSLRPKATGRLIIPSFRVGGETTAPIAINVSAAPQITSGNNEIFIDTFISKDNIYVQEQLLYTIKLFYTIGFDQGAQLSSPQVIGSVVQQLGSDETYQEIVDGIRYNVTERKFVIFPQSSGELEIPPISFNATVGRRGGLSRILSNRSNVREVNLISDAHFINVMPMPSDFPRQTWLPSSDFKLEESWSGPLTALAIGESLTRNILLTAGGLSSSLLPELKYEEIASLKFYPDQATREDISNTEGVTGKRSEGTALVPSASGDFILPAIEIPWWNTTTDSLEIASIPARTLSVLAQVSGMSTPPVQTDFLIANTAMQNNNPVMVATQTSGLYLYWIIATVLFAAAWLFSTIMWLRNRRLLSYTEIQHGLESAPTLSPNAPQGTTTTALTASQSTLPDLKKSYSVLKQACEQSNPTYIKRSLISWGQAYFQDRDILTLDNVKTAANNSDLDEVLTQLEQSLYSEQNTNEFNPKNLFDEVKRLQKSGNKKAVKIKANHSLPPLYKN